MPADRDLRPECFACPVGSLFEGLQSAQPDAMDHLLNAAQELVQVARSALDVADEAIEHQRSVRDAQRNRSPRVRRIDIV